MKRSKATHHNAVDRNTSLNAIPAKHEAIEETRLANGDCLLRYPAVPRKTMLNAIAGMIRRTPPKVRLKKLQLDSLGSEVWGMIDSQRTVQDIIERFAHHHQLSLREAEVAVAQFVRSLGRRGLIGLK